MQKLKVLFATIAISFSALVPPSSHAQNTAEMTRGEVRKVDKDTGKVTIKHDEIKSLEMAPMTMVFTVKDRSLLDKAKAGDKVMFSVVREGGSLVVTHLQTVP